MKFFHTTQGPHNHENWYFPGPKWVHLNDLMDITNYRIYTVSGNSFGFIIPGLKEMAALERFDLKKKIAGVLCCTPENLHFRPRPDLGKDVVTVTKM